MSFEEAMSLVELEHEFPAQLEDFHNRRAAALFAETGLDRELLGLPTVVVAGSCGKASTARFLAHAVAALFEQTGQHSRVGLGTKPPLHETLDGNRERYQIVNCEGREEWISRESFARIVSELPVLSPELAPYDLRYWILGRHFLAEQVGLGIVEANIGLRDDPANLFPDPVANLLTPIGIDHVSLLTPAGAPSEVLALGDRAGPLWHKFCGLPSGRLLVCGRQDADLVRLVEEYDGSLVLAGRDFSYRLVSQSLTGCRAVLDLDGLSVEVEIGALGRHQVENAAMAAATLVALCQRGVLEGQPGQISGALRTGLGRARMTGRMEVLQASSPTVVLNAVAGSIKLTAMMETLEEVAGGAQVEVALSVLGRLVPDGKLPSWLDQSLRRIMNSPVVVSFVATGFPEDISAEQLACWAREQTGGCEVRVSPPESLVSSCSADLLMLAGQSLAQIACGD